MQTIDLTLEDPVVDTVKEWVVLTDYRTEKQKAKDRFLVRIRHGKPRWWARPIVEILRLVVR